MTTYRFDKINNTESREIITNAKKGNLDFFDKFVEYIENELKEDNNVEILIKLLCEEFFVEASKNNYHYVVNHLIKKNYGKYINERVTYQSVRYDHGDLVSFYIEGEYPFQENICYIASRYDKKKCLNILLENDFKCDEDTFEVAAKYSLDCVILLYQNKCPHKKNIKNIKDEEIIKWGNENGFIFTRPRNDTSDSDNSYETGKNIVYFNRNYLNDV